MDYVFNTLSTYDGSVNDRKKKRLLTKYAGDFDVFDTLNDMEYKILGDLGYTGSLSDRWGAYYKALGGTGIESAGTLFSYTFYGSDVPAFVVVDQGVAREPSLVLDFCGGTHWTRVINEEDYTLAESPPALVLDFENNFFYTDT